MPNGLSPQLHQVDTLTQIAQSDHTNIQAPNSAVNIDINVAAAQAASSKPRTPKPTLRLPHHSIVGRAKLVEFVLAGLDAGRREFAFEHLPGVGKTTVASELIRDQRMLARFPDGVLWAHLGPDPDVRRQLRKWAKELGLSEDDLHDCQDAADLSQTVAEAIGERRMLLIIDDVWTSAACQYFMLGDPNCTRVITTRHVGIARELCTDDTVCEVRKLTTEEGMQMMAELAPQAVKIEPQAVRKLVQHVDGLPIALVLLGNLLRRKGQTRQAIEAIIESPDPVNKVFRERKPWENLEDSNDTLGEVIEASYNALGKGGPLTSDNLDGDLLRAALSALAVLRPDPAWFTPALVEHMTGAPLQVLDDLVDVGLIETVRYENSDCAVDDDLRYTMHRLIADYIRQEKLSPERRKALNLSAADYYREQLEALEVQYQKETDTSYRTMYRYENIEWQDAQDNWLYYLASTGYQRSGILAFLRAWFDGFWWWGCFLDFGFCDQLLRQWDERKLPRQAEVLLQLLRRFRAAYPKETEERSGSNWAEVQATLTQVRSLAAIDGPLADLPDPESRRLRALTDIFLAEAARFGRADHGAAQEQYREALALFRQADDAWNIAWTLYHLADMLHSCGRRQEARPLGAEALPIGRAEGDHEVQAVVHRLLGDIHRADGGIAIALIHYQGAVEAAYRFQVEPADPDPYTTHFYAQMTQLVAARLADLYAAASSPAQARETAQVMRQRWAAIGALPAGLDDDPLTAPDAQAIAARLFPPTLRIEELKLEGVRYRDQVRANLRKLQAAYPSDTGQRRDNAL